MKTGLCWIWRSAWREGLDALTYRRLYLRLMVTILLGGAVLLLVMGGSGLAAVLLLENPQAWMVYSFIGMCLVLAALFYLPLLVLWLKLVVQRGYGLGLGFWILLMIVPGMVLSGVPMPWLIGVTLLSSLLGYVMNFHERPLLAARAKAAASALPPMQTFERVVMFGYEILLWFGLLMAPLVILLEPPPTTWDEFAQTYAETIFE